jgi:hypothetical protein
MEIAVAPPPSHFGSFARLVRTLKGLSCIQAGEWDGTPRAVVLVTYANQRHVEGTMCQPKDCAGQCQRPGLEITAQAQFKAHFFEAGPGENSRESAEIRLPVGTDGR